MVFPGNRKSYSLTLKTKLIRLNIKQSFTIFTWADASKSSWRIDTGPSIVAGILVETLININCTELPSEAPTLAYRSVYSLLTDSVVQARVGVAVLPVVTALATQFGRTLAVEVVLEVDTLGPV